MKLLKMWGAFGLVAALAIPGSGTPAMASPSADPSAALSATPACGNSDLKAGYHAHDAAMSHRYGRIVLTNMSDHRCATGGYGGLSYVGGGDGTQIGAAADRDGGAVRTIVLEPGAKAISRVDETVAEVYPRHRCRPGHVDGFRVYVPNATRSQFVAHPTTGCRNHHVHLISHRPFHLR